MTLKLKSSGMPRNPRVRASCVWSFEGNACVKFKYGMKISLLWACASFIQRLGFVIAMEQERPARKPFCYGIVFLCASM